LLKSSKRWSKIRLENGKYFGIILKKDHQKNISGRKSQVFWVNIEKKVIGNLAYREMLFYKESPGTTVHKA